MKLVTGGDLYARVEPNGPGLSKSQAKRWMKQLCSAVATLHENGYVHADIKPENCMVDADENLLLGDFGLAVPINHVHTSRVPGTEAYMAPEMLTRSRKGVQMSPAVDVFALGITLYAMLFADLPWDAAHTKDRDFREFLRTQKLVAPGNAMSLLTSDLYKLLIKMVNPDPSQRATMHEVTVFFNSKQPWFVSKPTQAAPPKSPRISLPDIQAFANKPVNGRPVNKTPAKPVHHHQPAVPFAAPTFQF